jgi:hypothetical protein
MQLLIDLLEFFYLTPLPGSEDHKNLYMRGVAMDPDMNKYDLEHACTAHPLMSKEAWMRTYADAWKRYYTDEHAETILRRAVASGLNPACRQKRPRSPGRDFCRQDSENPRRASTDRGLGRRTAPDAAFAAGDEPRDIGAVHDPEQRADQQE